MRTAAAGLVAALALAGCGGDDDAEPAPEPAPAEEPAAEPASAPRGDATISIADFAFSGVSEVPVGTTVIVTNDDATRHTWSALDGSFDSGTLDAGETFAFTFDEPGTFDFQCDIHPSMQGRITVTG